MCTFTKSTIFFLLIIILDNLLPEGEARKLLAQNLGLSETHVFAQIRALGQDLSGAITFLDTDKVQDRQPIFRPINEQELIQRLQQKEDFGLLIWDDKPRLSVAGVQDKINVLCTDAGEIGFGDGSLCSTHILKFERRNCPHLVLNEFFCMRLAKIVGLPIANVTFKRTLAGQVLKALDEMAIDTLFDDSAVLTFADKNYWQELKENIELRTTHLLEQAEEIANIIV